MNDDGLLKMAELAEQSGVSSCTIKHYLREGLLPEPVRTSRNMAYYPPDFVERIRLIRRLQEERFMPLRVIKDVIEGRPRARGRAGRARGPHPGAGRSPPPSPAASRGGGPAALRGPGQLLARMEELGLLSPTSRGYDPDDVGIIEAVSRFRAGGYDESLGFTVYDALRYREHLQPLVEEEVQVLLDRLAGEVSVDRAAEIITAGTEPLRDLIGAVHSKLLLAELRRARESGPKG